jgi:uncharacterized protein with von Willebrand factor type A (vWA) domain
VPDLDLAGAAVGLGRALREEGVPTGPERSVRFARALELAPPADRDALYWTARAVFVSSRDQIEAFDRVFARLLAAPADPASWRGQEPADADGVRDRARERQAADPGSTTTGPLLTADARAAERDRDADSDSDQGVLAAASEEERLARKSFDALERDELAELRRMMARLSLAPPLRRTRRRRRGHHGERLDLRATIRRSLRTGGDPVEYARRRRRVRRRRLVMLLDVSGSMEPYSRAFVQFLESGVGGARAEAFVFATRLTRITRQLRGRNPQAAIDRAASAAPDWSGGTRIGAALKAFNDRYGRRGLARGAVVVILSDGWECGDCAELGVQMERLARLAHRIVWVNPRAAAPGFAPLAGGMLAALPHVDALASGHSLDALDEVLEAIAEKER